YESTISGLTTAMSDIHDLPEKPEILDKAQKQVALITKQFRRGVIKNVKFYGDFFGPQDINQLAEKLQGVKYDHDEIAKVLEAE
ncbi:lipoate protein ligase C-terminal domain-containing protein, partial [Limosilactobacillus reuteri]|uniref:lipoate protein ligase C-terminal domain-containing protein n=1 Tax=Limosilactobacillus reuteri TaxID=1598 RepID=UPI002B055020